MATDVERELKARIASNKSALPAEERAKRRTEELVAKKKAFLAALAAGVFIRDLGEFGVGVETRKLMAGLIRSSNDQLSRVNLITVPYSPNRFINWWMGGKKVSGWGIDIAQIPEGDGVAAITSTVVANPGFSIHACGLTRDLPEDIPLVDPAVVRESVLTTLAQAEIEWLPPHPSAYLPYR